MSAEKNIIEAPQAAKRAAVYLTQLMPQADNILLEEVEKVVDTDNVYWIITLSYQLNFTGLGYPGLQLAGNKRDYKIFRIDALTGEILSMKIRSL